MATIAQNLEILSTHLEDAYDALSANLVYTPNQHNATNLSGTIDEVITVSDLLRRSNKSKQLVLNGLQQVVAGDFANTLINNAKNYNTITHVSFPDLQSVGLSAFNGTFANIKSIKSCAELPATTLAAYCYSQMFEFCTSLTSAPELPATTLAAYCYNQMFAHCTALTSAPALPATTLAAYCYQFMFVGCTSLTTAPELPATTLADHCYQYMFQNCGSLTTAPALPATTLAAYCYNYIFAGCTSLTSAPELPATTLVERCYQNMFNGCTSLATAPALPVMTLATYCYANMFRDCTSLTTAPELPAANLATYCYYYMFYGCTNLKTIHDFPVIKTIGNNAMQYMFDGCTSLTSSITLKFDPSITAIPNRCLYHCVLNSGVPSVILDFSDFTSIPSVAGNNTLVVYSDRSDTREQILVPAALESEWKATTNWVAYADIIKGV